MTSGIKLCKRCQRPIDATQRADSIYCGDKCRGIVVAADRREKNRERHIYEQSLTFRFAFWIREFEQRVRAHAPENAGGYQAGLWTGSTYLWFPIVPSGESRDGKPKTRLTFYRKRTTAEFFLLDPFEPPTVPLATNYEIRFVSRLYPHPHLDDAGRFIQVIPYEMRINNLPVESLQTLPVGRHRR